MLENEKKFFDDSQKMWDIQNNGTPYCLPIDFNELRKLNAKKFKTKLIKKLTKNEVNYFIQGTELFIQESQTTFDWKLNFMAFTVKIKIKDEYIRVHAGFFMTAMTILEHLEKTGKELIITKIYGYSHGAGASPLLSLLLLDKTNRLPEIINFESPKCVFKPSKYIKHITRGFKNYKQGKDVVTTVPWWMSTLGEVVKIKGQKLRGIKKLLTPIFDHDIYWTKFT